MGDVQKARGRGRKGDNGKPRVCPPVAPPTTQGRPSRPSARVNPAVFWDYKWITMRPLPPPSSPSPTEKCRSKDPSPPPVPHEGERPPRRRRARERKFRVRPSACRNLFWKMAALRRRCHSPSFQLSRRTDGHLAELLAEKLSHKSRQGCCCLSSRHFFSACLFFLRCERLARQLHS